MQDTNNKNAPLELGRLIHILSCKMKCQNDCYTILEDSDLTPVQQQLLKFILLESAHKPIFQRDIDVRKHVQIGLPMEQRPRLFPVSRLLLHLPHDLTLFKVQAVFGSVAPDGRVKIL